MSCSECEAPARGPVPVEQLPAGDVPAHYCRQCAAHCRMRDYVAGQAGPVAARPGLPADDDRNGR